MSRREQSRPEPSRAQRIRAAGAAALSALAQRAAGGAATEAHHRALVLSVLRLALVRCAEVHHPAGRDRIASVLGAEEARGAEGARGGLDEAERLLRGAPAPDPYELGAVHEALLANALVAEGERLRVIEGGARRSAGAHYTPPALARAVVERAIGPLLPDDATPAQVLALRVCDAAMGAGAFLLSACDVLAERLVRARTKASPSEGDQANAAEIEKAQANAAEIALRKARREIAAACLFGVDKDPIAVALARAALWIAAASDEDPAAFLAAALRAGDALVGPPHAEPPWPRGVAPFDWREAFPAVFAAGGFDAIIGNPPWISYAGRAAQPLDDELFEFYKRSNAAFFGYRNLQGLFVHRAATLLRPGGRLGLVVPTSMSDLKGYEPSRRAHDAWCDVDAELPDFGDRFDDVFQPCMGLFSTRRREKAPAAGAAWPLERRDMDDRAAALLARLDALPKLPSACFGERGFQTMHDDVRKLRAFADPALPGEVGLRIGSDVAPFLRRAPTFRCDPRVFGARFRPEEEWRAVSVLLRQTARYPMACLADGQPFRNSVLAGFATDALPAPLLAAYLNSSPVRWFHFMRHRDARQGMPQLKIAHLRALPSPAADPAIRAALLDLGATLALRNDGIRPDEQRALDDLAADLLHLDASDRALVRAWAAAL